MNIVSLLPSATEILYSLGLGDRISGVTHECDYPPDVRRKTVVTRCAFDSRTMTQAEIDERVRGLARDEKSLYSIDEEQIRIADPDFIVTQELCDVCAVTPAEVNRVISKLTKRPEVISLNPVSVNDVFSDMIQIGRALHLNAEQIVSQLKQRIEAITAVPAAQRPRVGCIEWFNPIWRTGHWVPEMVEMAGGFEVFSKAGKPSRPLSWEELQKADPDILILMPCGCDLNRTREEFEHVKNLFSWDNLKAYKDQQIYLVDANAYFSRSGPRLVEGVELLAEIIHPEYFSGRAPIHSYTRIG
jgi:iron complex transport system substrate-binding protein